MGNTFGINGFTTGSTRRSSSSKNPRSNSIEARASKAGVPYFVAHLADPHVLTGEDSAEADLSTIEAQALIVGDTDGTVMKRALQRLRSVESTS